MAFKRLAVALSVLVVSSCGGALMSSTGAEIADFSGDEFYSCEVVLGWSAATLKRECGSPRGAAIRHRGQKCFAYRSRKQSFNGGARVYWTLVCMEGPTVGSVYYHLAGSHEGPGLDRLFRVEAAQRTDAGASP